MNPTIIAIIIATASFILTVFGATWLNNRAMDVRMQDFKTYIDVRFDGIKAEMTARFDSVNAEFRAVRAEMETIRVEIRHISDRFKPIGGD